MWTNGIIKWLVSRVKSMDQDISVFSDEILRVFGLHEAPEEERVKFLQSASESILTAVVGRVEAQLPEDKREEFFQLFEKPATDEEMGAFFKTYVPNFKELLVEELTRFKSEAMKHSESSKSQ